MAYAPIAKIEKFTGKKDDAQGETEAITTYLGCFYRNLCQIQAIQADYFTASQILNQFICGLHIPIHLLAAALGNLSAPTNSNTATELTSKWNPKAKIDTTKLEIVNDRSQQQNLGTGYTQNPNFQNYLSLLITPEDATSNKSEANQKPPTNNILPATITEDKSLTTIFFFEFKKPVETPLFSKAALKSKPITVIYTDAKVDKQHIKLILDSRLAGSIITKQLIDQLVTKTLIGKIDNFSIEVNSIIVPIKILNMQELQLSQNSQHIHVPITCGHFKTTNTPALIEFEEKEKKPTWEAYQVSWAKEDHNKLLPILLWDNNGKEKQKEKLT
ncbi:hypothetical protein G9A89_001944 [Geosiphon pyriformis]|nr:hypothetical protein G9A89_001944 [Geosiphon pyriformis]